MNSEGPLNLRHFRPLKPLGCGDTGSVHLVELRGSGRLFAMKAMDKDIMVNRNKVKLMFFSPLSLALTGHL